MNRLLAGIALALSLAAGCSGGVEIPTLEVGGSSGARLMNEPAKSPTEAYEKAYSLLSKAHYNVRRNLEARGQNQFGAREALRQVLDCLDLMRGCVPPAGRPEFDPYLSRYGEWLKDLDNGTWGGSFLTDLDRSERDLKVKFNPATTELLTSFPNAAHPPKPEPAAGSAPAASKPPDPGLSPDKVEVPPPAPGRPASAENSGSVRAIPGPSAAPPPPAASPRILYRAWAAAHDELIAAYRAHQPCKPKYEDLVESLKLLKSQLPADRAAKLQIYIEYYGGVEEKTRGFTILPEKTTEKDIIDELDVAARVIRKDFNPDK